MFFNVLVRNEENHSNIHIFPLCTILTTRLCFCNSVFMLLSFQLSVELLDYMDEILALQAAGNGYALSFMDV